MRQTLTNVFVLLTVSAIMLTVILGAIGEMENQRKEYFWQMRMEHLHRIAMDRHRRAERLRRLGAAIQPVDCERISAGPWR